jgi:hypothetical protein
MLEGVNSARRKPFRRELSGMKHMGARGRKYLGIVVTKKQKYWLKYKKKSRTVCEDLL